VRSISADEHLAHLQVLDSGQLPADPRLGEGQARVAGGVPRLLRRRGRIGVGLVLHRRLPRLKKTLAYLPEGPVLDWSRDDLSDQLAAMTRHLQAGGAFAVRMGPPVITAAGAPRRSRPPSPTRR
jgi:hypothetical protein